jgi:hypothetical protein
MFKSLYLTSLLFTISGVTLSFESVNINDLPTTQYYMVFLIVFLYLYYNG